ncbi:hypothetical protein EDD17DRAFT_1877742 [Pisolithus thermaeus]|nr:hypothetical protein EDD17DRAFT_1877742 [Pisolithus thermaeus]
MHTTPRNIHASFGAVKNAEVLVEWLLGALGRDRKRDDKASGHGPLSNPKCWSLLQQTLSSSASSVGPLKTWLIPLLHRTNLAGMVKELIILSHVHNVDLSGVYVPSRAVLVILWPLAEKRVGMDSLMECFAVVLGVREPWNDIKDDLTWICTTVVASYREVLGTFGNKKKLYTSFLSIHMPYWIRTHSSREDPSSKIPNQLHDTIYRAGIDTLFSVEGLKQPLRTFLDALSRAGADYGFNILPGLFSARRSAVNRCRNTPLSSSSGPTSSALATRGPCAWMMDGWAAFVGMLTAVKNGSLYTPSSAVGTGDQNTGVHRDTESTLIAVRGFALTTVENTDQAWSANNMRTVTLAVDALDMLTGIDYELVGEELRRMLDSVINLPRPLPVPTTDAVQLPLSDLLDYHARTRPVHTQSPRSLFLYQHTTSCSARFRGISRRLLEFFAWL